MNFCFEHKFIHSIRINLLISIFTKSHTFYYSSDHFRGEWLVAAEVWEKISIYNNKKSANAICLTVHEWFDNSKNTFTFIQQVFALTMFSSVLFFSLSLAEFSVAFRSEITFS